MRRKGTLPDVKSSNIIIRIHPEEKKELMERLAMEHMELSDYIRKLIELDKKEGYICRY